MNYGLYLSASGVLTNLYRQDVHANNLANAQTVAFKPDVPVISQRQPESIADPAGLDLRQDLLDRLGGGVFAGPQFINHMPAQLQQTGKPLDLAFDQENRFFAVSATDPTNGRQSIFLTRDGRMTRDADGYLTTATSGHRVLDVDDQPIQLAAGPISVSRSGQIIQAGEPVATIQIASVTDIDALQKQGRNLLKLNGPPRLRQVVKDPRVLSGVLEGSGTDPVLSLMKLIQATKAATSNANLIRYHDLLMEQAVTVLGRVEA